MGGMQNAAAQRYTLYASNAGQSPVDLLAWSQLGVHFHFLGDKHLVMDAERANGWEIHLLHAY